MWLSYKSIHYFLVLTLVCAASVTRDAHSERRIKMYALYTPSHKVLLDDWFLPSIKDDYEIILEFVDIPEGDGRFRAQDWFKAVDRKVDLIIRAIQENWGRIFIFSDVDITYYEKTQPYLEKVMRHFDIVFQRDNPTGMVCTGFFASWGNTQTLKFWLEIKDLMQQYANKWHDQTAANYLLRKGPRRSLVRWRHLPPEFFSGGTLTGASWKPGKELPVPSNIILHHANFTKGVKYKVLQLEYVKNIVEARKHDSAHVDERITSSENNLQ